MEFAILNQLTDIAQFRLRSSQAYFNSGEESSGPSGGAGSSGSRWDPPTRASSRRGSALQPNTLGVLPDIENDAEAEVSGANTARTDSEIPLHREHTRKISTVAPLGYMVGRMSESKVRRPNAVRTVSFTEGCGPSTRGNDKLEEKWRAMWKDVD
jgi:hypothetical protein